jgi:DNA-binding CsgD family transcriptional regulator
VQSGDNSGKKKSQSPSVEKISIPYSRSNLSLVYSFPFFPGQEVKFQYLIEGLTDEWSSLYETPEFIINRIPAGNYNVKVRAVNKWKKSSEVNQIALSVAPPFYRSGWAFMIYFFILVTILILVRYLIRRKLEIRERQRTEEKEQEMIKQRNKKLRSDLSFKSRQLATSALSMAKKNESLLEIKKKLSSQKEKLGTRYPDRYFNEIIRKIDEGVTGDDEWKVFEHNFNLAHETFLHQLKDEYPDLTPNDLRLCAFLRINLASKEIASLLGISVRGVENHRYRLRKKLNLAAEDDLAEFLFTFQGEDEENGLPTINNDK